MNVHSARPLGLPAVIAFGLIACVLYGFAAGLRSDIGILLPALVDHTGLSYQEVSLCIAVMNLVFGATQPAFGMLADRTSNREMLLIGAGLIAVSLIGVLFFCHQIGGFLSAWLGGALLDATGSYVALWLLDAGLCTFAALASSRIGSGKHAAAGA